MLRDPFRWNTTGAFGPVASFRARPSVWSFIGYSPSLVGVSRDPSGTAIGSCTVVCLRMPDYALLDSTISDASGNYALYPTASGPYQVLWYKSGSPDIAGISKNSLLAT